MASLEGRERPGAAATADGKAAGVLVFLPTFNDFDGLPALVAEVVAAVPGARVLVIDDGSQRPFDPADLPAGTLYVRLPFNCGLGVCTQVAIDHMLAHGYAWLARLDADGQHPAARLPDLLAPLAEGRADLTVGVRENHREAPQADRPLRNLVKDYYRWACRLATGGQAPSDPNSGLHALGRKAAAVLSQAALERFPEPEMYVIACRARLRVVEVRVEQGPRLAGRSTLTVTHALRMLFRFNVFLLNELVQGRRR